jgi:hypothetical protein
MIPSSSLLNRGWPFLAGVLAIGAFSQIFTGAIDLDKELDSGRYVVEKITSEESGTFSGPVFFEYSAPEEGLSDFTVFKLHFLSSRASGDRSFGILIPLKGDEDHIRVERYRVDSNNNGFMNGYGTVFGYADFGDNATTLYFAESGGISISQIEKGEITGEIDIVLGHGSGQNIRLKGDFNALPVPPE